MITEITKPEALRLLEQENLSDKDIRNIFHFLISRDTELRAHYNRLHQVTSTSLQLSAWLLKIINPQVANMSQDALDDMRKSQAALDDALILLTSHFEID